MNWRGALFAALMVLAAASGWSVWKQRTAAPAAAAPSERSDYVLEDFQLVALDDDGREAFTLRAPWLRRNPADDTLSLRDPLFLLPEDEGDFYWDLRAATGWISADSERMRLETTALEVLPRQRRAHTDAAVTVTQPGTTMRGTGMEADLAGKRFQLTSKVHTRYVPSRR